MSLLLLASAAEVAAQDASTPLSLELYSTYHSIGARLAYSGDDDADAAAWIEWRPAGSADWNRGVDLTRITNRRWAGSLLGLEPAVAYEARTVISDPDGGGNLAGAIVTRAEPDFASGGPILWVAPNGDDGNTGGWADPLATIQAAADRADPGTEIRVRPGIYHEALSLVRSGNAEALIRLTASAPGVILDGSDPAYLHRSDWREEGDGLYSVPFAQPARLICADSTQRLYHHATVAALRTHAFGIAQGWTLDGGRLYVLLEDASSPSGHTMHVARFNWGIYVDADYWWIDGLEIRYFGHQSSTASGIALWDARGCVLSGNYTHSIGGRQIFLRTDTRETLVEGNSCIDFRVGTWPWEAVKGHEEESSAISNRGDRGNVIRGNHVAGTFNGIDLRPVDADENGAADCDVQDNLVEGIGDDAIEIDEVSGLNVRVFGNRLRGDYNGLSLAPIYQGPTYLLRNTVSDYRRSGLKTSLESVGEAWICHNTMSTREAGRAAIHPSGHYSNLRFRNNILTGNLRECVADDGGESQTGNDFDFDLLSAPGYPMLFRWKGVSYPDLASLRTATGFEWNGRAGEPGFRAPESGDYTLLADSPAIDAALRMPGINDRYTGDAPDIGAWEFDPTPSLVPDGAPREGSDGAMTVSVCPNPSGGAVEFRVTGSAAGALHAELFDVDGRRVRALPSTAHFPGSHVVRWNGCDARGAPVSAGIYLLRVRSATGAISRRIVRLP